jgi:ubiquinone biosynthesis protein COQ9
MKNIEEERDKFIEKSVDFICNSGWTNDSMEDASEALGKDKIYYKLLFADMTEIVRYFEDKEDERMLKKTGKKKESGSIREHIGLMLQTRIKEMSGGPAMLLKLREFYLSAKHIADGPKAVWSTSDIIWKAAGDKSTDMNYYSKRFLLSGVYAASIHHYLAHEGEDIDEFIVKSLDKVVSCAKYLKMPKLEDIPILRMFS